MEPLGRKNTPQAFTQDHSRMLYAFLVHLPTTYAIT